MNDGHNIYLAIAASRVKVYKKYSLGGGVRLSFLDLDGQVLPIANPDDAIYKEASQVKGQPVARDWQADQPPCDEFLDRVI